MGANSEPQAERAGAPRRRPEVAHPAEWLSVEPGAPLAPTTRARLERAFRTSLGDVRVHTGSRAEAAADGRGAEALAVGSHLLFAPSRYRPGTAAGERLLGHEVHHVLSARAQPSAPADVAAEERAAEAAAQHVAEGGVAGTAAPPPLVGRPPTTRDRILRSARPGGQCPPPLREAPEPQPLPAEPTPAPGAEGATGEAEPPGSAPAPGWLVEAVREFSPELADLIDRGFEAAFLQEMEAAVRAAIREQLGELSVEHFVDEVNSQLGEGAALLAGAALGDMRCCEAFAAWLGAFNEAGVRFVTTDGPLARLLSGAGEGLSGILRFLGGLLDGAGSWLMERLQPWIDGWNTVVDGVLAGIRGVNQWLGDEVAKALGVDPSTGGFVGLVQEIPDRILAWVRGLVAEAIDALLGLFFQIPGMTELYRLADLAVEMQEGVSWLLENWARPDLWEAVATELPERLPRFAAVLTGVHEGWLAMFAVLEAGWGSLWAAVDGWLARMTGVPLLSEASSFIRGLVEGVRWITGSPLWGQIGEALSAAGAFALEVVGGLADVASLVGMVVANPLAAPVLLGAAAFRILPDCYKPPIFDFLLVLWAGSAEILLTGLFPSMPWVVVGLQPVLEGVLLGLRGLAAEEKEAFLNGAAEALSGGWAPEILAGLLAGVVVGAVEEVVFLVRLLLWLAEWMVEPLFGSLDALWELLTAPFEVAGDVLGAAWQGVLWLDAAGDRHFGPPPRPEAAPEPDPEAEAEQAVVDEESLADFFGALLGSVHDSIAGAAASTAQAVIRAVIWVEDNPFTIAYHVGRIAGMLIVDYLATLGIGEVFGMVKAGVELLGRGAVEALRASPALLEGALQAGRGMVRGAVTLLRELGFTWLDELALWIERSWARLELWIDELLGRARPPAEPGAHPPGGVPAERVPPGEGGPPTPGGAGQAAEQELRLALLAAAELGAQEAYGEVVEEADTDLLTEEEAEDIVNAEDVRVLNGFRVNVTLTPVPLTSSWGVTAVASFEGLREPGFWGFGWVATEEDERTRWYADHSARAEDEWLLDELLDEVTDWWGEHPGEDVEAVESELHERAPSVEAELDYPNQMVLTLSRAEAGPDIADLTAVITPNAASRRRRIPRPGTPGGASAELVAAVDVATSGTETGIVAFLLNMARGITTGTVTARDFSSQRLDDPASPYHGGPPPTSWYHRDPVSGALANQDYVKTEFRAAMPASHEWIPCARIGDVVDAGRTPGQEELAAYWVSIQHNVRAPTSSLVFMPARSEELCTILEGVVAAADGDPAHIPALVAEAGLDSRRFALTGHVGAIYLEPASARTQQTSGTGTFHNDLYALWSVTKAPTTWANDVREHVRTHLWDGDLRLIFPESMKDEPATVVAVAAAIPNHYVDSGGSRSWGADLLAMAGLVRDRLIAVIDVLRAVRDP